MSTTDRVEKPKNPHNLYLNLNQNNSNNRQKHHVHMINGKGRIHKQSASVSGYYPSENLLMMNSDPPLEEAPHSGSGSGSGPTSADSSSGNPRSIPMVSPRYRNFSRPNTFYDSSTNNDAPTVQSSRSYSIRKVPNNDQVEISLISNELNNTTSNILPLQKTNWSSFVNNPAAVQVQAPAPAVPPTIHTTTNTVTVSTTNNTNTNNTNTVNNVNITNTINTPSKVRTKTCKKCLGSISGQFVRALDSAYHIECFTCAHCNQQCSSKFFPTDNPNYDPNYPNMPSQIPLCERCYFKRLDLLCFACNGALRGSYITALGRKYHVDHFTCSMCDTVFGPEDSYYEHGDSIYCHFHYSTLYASKCEGCQTAILKQFVEIYRGGREQQWHPECYMIFKFWNVKLCPEGSKPTLNPLRPLSITASAPLEELNHSLVAYHENEVEERVYRIWTVLCGYEEATASYISDMLQSASNGKYHDALNATANLVSKIDILFAALDGLNELIEPFLKIQEERNKREEEDEDNSSSTSSSPHFTILGREAKNLCKKIVEFMSMVSRSREKNVKKMGITLLNLVTSLAHYLKVLIRYGLSNSLLYDRSFANGNAINSFLEKVEIHTQSKSVLNKLGVSAVTSDKCNGCDLTVEDVCIRYGDKLWHIHCLTCNTCRRKLGNEIHLSRWISSEKVVKCQDCDDNIGKNGFVYVTKLRQFVFLVKIAVARLQLVLSAYDERDKKAKRLSGGNNSISTPSLIQYGATTTSSNSANIRINQSAGSSSTAVNEPTQNEKGYMTTLTDIRRLRSAKLDRQVSEMSRKARQSRILTMPDSESGQVNNESNDDRRLSVVDKVSRLSMSSSQLQPPPAQLRSKSEPEVRTQPRSRSEVEIEQDQREKFQRLLEQQLPTKPVQAAQPQSTQPSQPAQPQSTQPAQPTHPAQPTQTPRQMLPPASQQKQKSLIKNAKRTFSIKRKKEIRIEEVNTKKDPSRLDRTTDLFKNEKSLTLDDIPRIVAAEQAREQLPNAFRHQPRTISVTNSVPIPKSISDSVMKEDSKKFMSELTNKELFYIRHICILLIHPLVQEWFSLEELFDLIETRRQQSIWGKFGKAFGGNGSSNDIDNITSTSSTKKKTSNTPVNVFGTSLEVVVERYGVDSTLGVGPKPLRIPAFVDDCISSMRQKDMSVEGIFRKNGNIRRLKEFTEKIDKNPDKGGILSEENAIQLAALLKKYLRELPEPLMTSKLQKLWIVAQKIADSEVRRRVLHLTCCLLPKTHREVMEVLFYFLNWTASFSHIDEETGSKMDAHNLATVITPNILYIKEGGHESGDAYFLSIESVNTLIEEQSRFAEVPMDILIIFNDTDLINSSNDITSKEINMKIEQYLKANGSGGNSGSSNGNENSTKIRVNTSAIAGQEASIKRVQSSELSPNTP